MKIGNIDKNMEANAENDHKSIKTGKKIALVELIKGKKEEKIDRENGVKISEKNDKRTDKE